MKHLATLVVGVFLPRDEQWRAKHFGNVGDDVVVDGQRIRDFLLKECKFKYLIHSIKNSSYNSAQSMPTSVDAKRAATALAQTAGATAANAHDHDQYATLFRQSYDALVTTQHKKEHKSISCLTNDYFFLPI